MNLVFHGSKMEHGARLVMLAIADNSDDNGRAFPSVKTIDEKAMLSERAVQASLRKCVDSGELVIDANEGYRSCNLYHINVAKLQIETDTRKAMKCTPADSAPPQILRETPQILHLTPADSAPKPSGNHQEPSGNVESEARATLQQVTTFCLQRGLLATDAEYIFNVWENNEWTVKRKKIKKWKSVVISWQLARHFPSQKVHQSILALSGRPNGQNGLHGANPAIPGHPGDQSIPA